MAIEKFNEDVEIISKLGDYPGSDDNLTTDSFRKKFDEAAIKFKNYLNNVLIPSIDQIVDVKALLNATIDKTLTQADKSAEAKATGDALSRKLSKYGDTMLGVLNMGNYRISNVSTPSMDADAANKKYVDGTVIPAAFPSSGWSDAAPYTQTVNVEGITVNDNPDYWVIYSGTNDEQIAQKEAFSAVDKLETADGSVTVTCLEDKPEVNITIGMEVHR